MKHSIQTDKRRQASASSKSASSKSASSKSASKPRAASAAPKLKELFDARAVKLLAAELRSALPTFDIRAFERDATRGLAELELTQRAWHLAEAMHAHLPKPFTRAVEVIVASLGPELKDASQFGLSPLRYMPHVFYVQKYGLDDFEAAMTAQFELTKRFSAESSIRPFLEKYPERTYARLMEWSEHPNVHVRRLVSEGTRPRLPWAPRLREFQRDPRPILALLERLKDDPERYVQRSVANNLNDIAKDHPELVVETCRRWATQASVGRRWIIGHALRSLIKQGDRGALTLMGAGQTPKVRVGALPPTPRLVRLGEHLSFSFELESTARRAQDLIVDYAVHFLKGNGRQRAKVFKLRRLRLEPGQKVKLSARVRFTPMTTRQHHAGMHRIALLVNGHPYDLGEFELRA